MPRLCRFLRSASGEGRSDTAGVVQQAGQITPEGPRRALDEEAWQEFFRIQEPRECGCQAQADPALRGDRCGGARQLPLRQPRPASPTHPNIWAVKHPKLARLFAFAALLVFAAVTLAW